MPVAICCIYYVQVALHLLYAVYFMFIYTFAFNYSDEIFDDSTSLAGAGPNECIQRRLTVYSRRYKAKV